jgi:phosphatidylglycerophosphate synthase
LTLAALLISISAVAVNLWFDTTLSKRVPDWVIVYSLVCMFVYQTLDAVDGKQARRTGTSSPLGQLFDHGCDGINTLLYIILFWQSFQRGPTWGFFIMLVSSTFSFYMAQWEEKHTH